MQTASVVKLLEGGCNATEDYMKALLENLKTVIFKNISEGLAKGRNNRQ